METLTLTPAELADLETIRTNLVENGDTDTILFIAEQRAAMRGQTLQLQTTGNGWTVSLIDLDGTTPRHWTGPTLKAAIVQSFADA